MLYYVAIGYLTGIELAHPAKCEWGCIDATIQ
jgi:hypothetical protein